MCRASAEAAGNDEGENEREQWPWGTRREKLPGLVDIGPRRGTSEELHCSHSRCASECPKKEFVWFENSAHLPMTEEPGKFFDALLRVARPIAEATGDVPPR